MEPTTTTEISQGVDAFYNRTMLERGLPFLTHDKWAQVRDIPANNGNVQRFRKYTALTPNTTALTQGVTPAGKQLSKSDVTITVYQYGDFVTVTDFLMGTTLDPVLTEAAELLGEQMGQSLDQILRDVLNAGTSVQYCGSSNTQTSDVAAGDELNYTEIILGVKTLKVALAQKLTRMVNPDTGYATTPLDACYVGIIHPNVTWTFKDTAVIAAGLFKRVQDYARQGNVMQGEVGAIDEVRFVETTYAKVKTAEGTGGIDVYCTLFLGANAYAITRINGMAVQNIVKPIGSGQDPLNQRGTSGWKATFGCGILQQLFMLRLEHSLT